MIFSYSVSADKGGVKMTKWLAFSHFFPVWLKNNYLVFLGLKDKVPNYLVLFLVYVVPSPNTYSVFCY